MFIADMPNVPPQDVPVMIAQASQAEQGSTKPVRTVGICQPVQNVGLPSGDISEVVIRPASEAATYFLLYEHREVEETETTTVLVLNNPKHGTLKKGENGYFSYLPKAGYLGKDSATVLVDIKGLKVKVVYSFLATDSDTGGNRSIEILCGKKGYRWKISANIDANGNNTIKSVEYLPTKSMTKSMYKINGVYKINEINGLNQWGQTRLIHD